MAKTSRPKMNVLQVVEACNAGVGRHVRGLCEGLVAEGHRVTVAYAPHRTDEAFEKFLAGWRGRISFVPLPVGRRVSPLSDLWGVFRLVRLIRSRGPFDVVHGHSSKGGALARMAGRLCGAPTVYTPNSLVMASPEISRTEALFYTLVERALGCWMTSRLIAVSRDEREFVLRLGLVAEKHVLVIENGIDDKDFEHHSRKDLKGPLTFGAALRFSAQKAPGRLVAAFVRLCHELPQLPARLVIVGDGELFEEVREQAEASGFGHRISLPGWRTDTREVLRGFDVFVLSSLYEGFSYGVLEAMAAGLPIVSTEVFGAGETVARVPGNVLVPPGDIGALAAGMRRMATVVEPGSLRRMLREIGRANREYARTHFAQSEVTRRTLEVYRALC